MLIGYKLLLTGLVLFASSSIILCGSDTNKLIPTTFDVIVLMLWLTSITTMGIGLLTCIWAY